MPPADSKLLYRTTLAVTFWTKTTSEAEKKAEKIAKVADMDEDQINATVEYHAAGRPAAPEPVEPTEPEPSPPPGPPDEIDNTLPGDLPVEE